MTLFMIFAICCLTICVLCAIIALGVAVLAFVEVKSLQKSTHTMQWMPVDPKWASSEEDLNKATSPGKEELPTLDPDELEESEIDLRKMI
jgi:hypothetical protein